MKVIIFTWSNHHLVTKTTCFGMRFIHFTTLCNTLFTSKTTCFGLMKAYEGKSFAFIRASCWLLTPYTNHEGKLDFKQKNVWIKGDWTEMICLSDTRIPWFGIQYYQKTIKSSKIFFIVNSALSEIITYRIILFLCIILFFPKLFCTFVTVSVDLAKIFSVENEVNENGAIHIRRRHIALCFWIFET